MSLIRFLLLLCCVLVLSQWCDAWIVVASTRNDRTATGRNQPQSTLFLFKDENNNNNDNVNDEYVVEVIYEGLSCTVPIRGNETILSGLERNQVPERLGLPELPSQCRRGNCLTCVGRHAHTSQINSLQKQGDDDGLSPELSRQVSKLGYVLACNSHVVGDGVQLILGENHAAWQDLYVHRLTHESTQYVARSAMARTIRHYDERHPLRWKLQTETILQKSGEPQQE